MSDAKRETLRADNLRELRMSLADANAAKKNIADPAARLAITETLYLIEVLINLEGRRSDAATL